MKKKLSITIDMDVAKKIEILCEKEDRSISNMINTLLKQAINNKTSNNDK